MTLKAFLPRTRRLFRVAILPVAALMLLAGCNRDPKAQSADYVARGNRFYDKGQPRQASIMYRRALQKDLKNGEAWYKLGLINLSNGALGEGRGNLVRVADLGESENKFDDKVKDALTHIADIDYTGYAKYPDSLKEFYSDLQHRAALLKAHYPNTFEALRIKGLARYADVIKLKKREERVPIIEEALTDFLQADKLRPYDPSLGFAIIASLSEVGRGQEAEAYASEMVTKKTADERVYSSLYWHYIGNGKLDQAEGVRRREVENNPKEGQAYTALASHYYLVKDKAKMDATLSKLTGDLKTFPTGYMMVGDFFYSLGHLSEALPFYEKGATADPNNKAAYWKKEAEANTLLGKYDAAAKRVADLLKLDPNDPEAVAMDVSLQLNTAKREQADPIIARLTPLLAKTSPTEPERSMILHFNLGRAYALKGDAQSMDQARLQFEEALKARDNSKVPYVPALMALAQIQLARNSNPEALEYSSRVIQYDPGNLPAHLIRTGALTNLGEYDKARQELEAILKAKPDSADTIFSLARLDLIQKHYPEAEAEFSKLVEKNDPRGLTGLVECKVQQKEIAEAVQLIQTQLSNTPNNPAYRNALATLDYNTGDFASAAREFQKLIDDNPNYENTTRAVWYLRLGESLRRSNNFSGAISAFSKAGEIVPKQATPKLELGLLYESAGRVDEALKQYAEVLNVDPENTIALNNIAYHKADSGTDLDGALAYAQKARTKAPTDPDVQDTFGLIYYKKDMIDDSLRVFNDLVGKAPQNPTYHLHLAMVLVRKGDNAKARRELDLANRNSPSNHEQEQIKQLLSKIG